MKSLDCKAFFFWVWKYQSEKVLGMSRSDSIKLSDSVSNYTGGCVCIHWEGGMGVELYPPSLNRLNDCP